MAGRNSPFVMHLVFLAIFSSCTRHSTHAEAQLQEGKEGTESSIPVNVTVFYYNISYNRAPVNRVLYNQPTYYRDPNLTTYFVELFKKVQESFLNLSVRLNITVHNVFEKKTWPFTTKAYNKSTRTKR
uniref:Putative secreted protein n=1 Tax=Rhipicephalus microplus TaxID=6941 RepID=A0A6G5A583_RHIMP